jgi:glucose-1-phosphate thymidylyltransferase
LEEKPTHPKSNWAVPGMYFYDNSASQRAKNLLPSSRGEIEITDLNLSYLHDGALQAERLPSNTYWLDTGSPKLMLEASKFVQNLQENEECLIGSPEEVAFQLGWIGQKEIGYAIDSNAGSAYEKSLRRVLVRNYDK